jgi:flagellar protein FliO/FliZ
MRFTVVILTALFCLNAYGVLPGDETAMDPSDEALIEAAERLVLEGNGKIDKKRSEARSEDSQTEAAIASTETASTPVTEQKESEIPVQLTAATKAKDNSGVMWRLAASFGVLALAAGVFYYAARRWSSPKSKAASGARIEMVHQYHMGPRKSVALIRVAGETILLGCTDHNVNMIKPVVLIDDELEGLMKKDFNNFLEDEFSIEDVRTALRS